MKIAAGSPFDRLKQIADPRDPKGRRYRLPGLVGMMVLGAMQGERSLSGMWRWGRDHWADLVEPLDLWGTPKPPSFDTTLHLLKLMDAGGLAATLGVILPATITPPETDTDDEARGQVRRVLRLAGEMYARCAARHAPASQDPIWVHTRILCEVSLADLRATLSRLAATENHPAAPTPTQPPAAPVHSGPVHRFSAPPHDLSRPTRITRHTRGRPRKSRYTAHLRLVVARRHLPR